MNERLRACSTALLLASPLVAGCGAATYIPRPSPRIQVVSEGTSLALVKNGRSYPLNLFGSNLDDVVEGNPKAESEAHEYRSKAVTSFVLSTVGSVSAGVGAGLLIGDELQSSPSSSLLIGSLVMALGGAVLSIVGGTIGSNAQPHLWNAINIYNDGLPIAYPAWHPQAAYPGYPPSSMPFPGIPLPATAAPPPSSPAPARTPAPSGAPVPPPVPSSYAPLPGVAPHQ